MGEKPPNTASIYNLSNGPRIAKIKKAHHHSDDHIIHSNLMSGRSSGVEHLLPKQRAVGSNPIARFHNHYITVVSAAICWF